MTETHTYAWHKPLETRKREHNTNSLTAKNVKPNIMFPLNPCKHTLIDLIKKRQKLINKYKKILQQINQAKKHEKQIPLKEFEKQIKQMQKGR